VSLPDRTVTYCVRPALKVMGGAMTAGRSVRPEQVSSVGCIGVEFAVDLTLKHQIAGGVRVPPFQNDGFAPAKRALVNRVQACR